METRRVYTVMDEGPLIPRLLREAGYEVIVGDGSMNLEHLSTCQVLIPGKCRVGNEELNAAARLEMVSKVGVGVEKIDIPACTAHGIQVANTPKANAIAVAEHTMALMLALSKRIQEMHRLIHEERIIPKMKDYPSVELYGMTVSVVGYGTIGRRVAAMCRAFGMHVAIYDPYVDPQTLHEDVEVLPELDMAFEKADVLTIHVAGVESNRHMVNRERLSKMKKTALLINTTRGMVVDEEALYQALSSGQIRGAGLDVFETEPVPLDHKLLTLPNVIATPHFAANTLESRTRMQEQCVQNILSFYEKGSAEFALNLRK